MSEWLSTAAAVPGFIGFAVGRTSFWEPVAAYVAGTASRAEAADRIAAHFLDWVRTFEDEKPAASAS